MIWSLYMLARSPEVQTQLAEEVMRNSPQMWLTHPLLKAVTRETLRLYPAAPFLTRQLATDLELSGYSVPSGVRFYHYAIKMFDNTSNSYQFMMVICIKMLNTIGLYYLSA